MTNDIPEGGWELHPDDDDYPIQLFDLQNPPEVLYGVGDKDALKGALVGVVGARDCTPYGKSVAQLCGRCIGEAGATVVSGGARGIDNDAAYCALKVHEGKTIVVAPCGADKYYPESSKPLYDLAKSQKGSCVVSIFPWGSEPEHNNFLARNEITAALSEHLIVVECEERSGTMNTVREALNCGNSVYAVPGSIFSSTSQSTNNLIQRGVVPITCEQDIKGIVDSALDLQQMHQHSANYAAGIVQDIGSSQPLSGLVADCTQAAETQQEASQEEPER